MTNDVSQPLDVVTDLNVHGADYSVSFAVRAMNALSITYVIYSIRMYSDFANKKSIQLTGELFHDHREAIKR